MSAEEGDLTRLRFTLGEARSARNSRRKDYPPPSPSRKTRTRPVSRNHVRSRKKVRRSYDRARKFLAERRDRSILDDPVCLHGTGGGRGVEKELASVGSGRSRFVGISKIRK